MEDSKEMTCPCTPKCENYGNCKACIAAHAPYHSAPLCIRKMQADMKKNHLHVVNPHETKSLTEKIQEYYAEHPNEHLRTIAETLKVTDSQLLEAHPEAEAIPTADVMEVYGKLTELDRVLLHMDGGCVVLQLETKLPEAMNMKGTVLLKQSSGEMNMTSLMFPNGFYEAFLVRENLYGKESLSAVIVGEDEKTALSIYMRRNQEGAVDPASKELFEALWAKYQK